MRGRASDPRPLDGMLVVTLEQAVAAPFATRQLADLGARVIKVERPPTPGELRGKLSDCLAGLDADPSSWTWDGAAEVLARFLPAGGGR